MENVNMEYVEIDIVQLGDDDDDGGGGGGDGDDANANRDVKANDVEVRRLTAATTERRGRR